MAKAEKTLPDLKTFIEDVNRKEKKHAGIRYRLHSVKKKRK